MSGSRFNPIALVRAFLRPLDPILMLVLGLLLGAAWVLMQSASPERLDSQGAHFAIALGAMWLMAWVSPARLLRFALPLYALGVPYVRSLAWLVSLIGLVLILAALFL